MSDNDEIARKSAQWLIDAYAGMDENTLRPSAKHGLIVAWENIRLRREIEILLRAEPVPPEEEK